MLGTYHGALFLNTKVAMREETHFHSCFQVSHEFALNFNPSNPYCSGKSPILQHKADLFIPRGPNLCWQERVGMGEQIPDSIVQKNGF